MNQALSLADDRLMNEAIDDNGNSLWNVFTLAVLPGDDPATLAKEVTLTTAMQVMQSMNAEHGPCALVLWPSWAAVGEMDVDNDQIFASLCCRLQVERAQKLLPPKPTNQKEKSKNKRGKQ